MPENHSENKNVWWRWLAVAACALAIAFAPVPEGIKRESWILRAIFIATIVGSVVRPVSVGATLNSQRGGGQRTGLPQSPIF